MNDKATEKKIKKLEKEVDKIWMIIKERDNYLFGILDKHISKIERELKALKKKR
jgi:hypothetical protein